MQQWCMNYNLQKQNKPIKMYNVKPLMKGSEYNYHPEILNSFHAINTLQSEFCLTY